MDLNEKMGTSSSVRKLISKTSKAVITQITVNALSTATSFALVIQSIKN